ncbi:MAG: hypothetical protein V3T48_07285, partial [Vicinamibacterales bacterium]
GGRYIETDERDIPDTFMMTVDYPTNYTVILISVMTNDVGIQTVIHGQHATLELGDRTINLTEQSAWWQEFRKTNAGLFAHRMVDDDEGARVPDPPPGKATFSIHSAPRRDHMGNFIDSVRGEASPHCNVELGCSTMVAIKMGVEAYRQSRTLLWDADSERVITR